MLRKKTAFATMVGVTGSTGQNILFYNPTTDQVNYSINPIGGGSVSSSFKESTTPATNSTSTYATYFTSDTLPAGTYFIIVCFLYSDGEGTTTNFFDIINNSTGVRRGAYTDVISLGTNRTPGSICWVSTLTNSNTFSFLYRTVTAGVPLTVEGAMMSIFRVGQ
jgi:hypothetical protein